MSSTRVEHRQAYPRHFTIRGDGPRATRFEDWFEAMDSAKRRGITTRSLGGDTVDILMEHPASPECWVVHVAQTNGNTSSHRFPTEAEAEAAADRWSA